MTPELTAKLDKVISLTSSLRCSIECLVYIENEADLRTSFKRIHSELEEVIKEFYPFFAKLEKEVLGKDKK